MEAVATRPPTLTGAQKAAALLITLGTATAAKILARLPSETIDLLATELVTTPGVPPDVRDAVLEETHAALFAQMGELAGGVDYAVDLFTQAFGESKGQLMLERINQRLARRPFEFLRHVDPIQVAELLAGEHPQTIAVVLSYLEPRTAAQILVQFGVDLQVEVARRIAETEQTTPDAIGVVEEGIKARMSALVADSTEVGGVRPLAHVLNQVDRSTERQILARLAEEDEALAEEVRRYMFVFEDIVQLDDRSLQRVIRDVDPKDIALALRATSEDVKQKFFANMSQRAAEMLREEMSLAGQVRMRNVEEAQGRIVDVIKRLEDQDEIVIERGGGGDQLV